LQAKVKEAPAGRHMSATPRWSCCNNNIVRRTLNEELEPTVAFILVVHYLVTSGILALWRQKFRDALSISIMFKCIVWVNT